MSIDTSLLKTWIRENPEKAPSAKIVAVHHGFPIDSVRKEFHRKEGMTLGRFIADTRLEFVQKVLLTTEKTCFEIASELQLREDVLARWYKQRTGITMEGFRRKNGTTQTQRGGVNPSDDNVMSEIANHYCKPKLQREFA
ncbi:MAG: helix-turn-helix transcriptional regulator [Bacteroidetes bacterium]|nr:helix-turn-helix transcriptional regulator [Bacteroidota bacterium]MCW5896481.1 helix-turn-helix transcriptional regulator [Bacteroidota bacterium]